MPLSAWVSVAEKVPFGLRQSSNIRPSMMPRAITSSLCSADDSALTTAARGAPGFSTLLIASSTLSESRV